MLIPDPEIRYYKHFERARREHLLPEGSGEMVLQRPDAYYYDTLRNRMIAVKRVFVPGAERDVAVAYEIADNTTWLVTVFPLKEGQQRNRQESGRWVQYEPES